VDVNTQRRVDIIVCVGPLCRLAQPPISTLVDDGQSFIKHVLRLISDYGVRLRPPDLIDTDEWDNWQINVSKDDWELLKPHFAAIIAKALEAAQQ